MNADFRTTREAINTAPDEQTLQNLLREVVASTISGAEIAAFPPPCQSALTAPIFDIQVSAVSLLHCELAFRGDETVGALLREVAFTFSVAAVRLAQLKQRPA